MVYGNEAECCASTDNPSVGTTREEGKHKASGNRFEGENNKILFSTVSTCSFVAFFVLKQPATAILTMPLWCRGEEKKIQQLRWRRDELAALSLG